MSASPSSVQLYLDTDVQKKLARLLRERGFDAISAYEVGHAHLPDPEHLIYAAEQERVLLTYNIGDFMRLYQAWWNEGRQHAGVVVSRQLPLGELLRRTLRLLETVPADEMVNNIRNLAEFASRPTEER